MPVFAWITGQDYNIGDSILRRPYVNALTDVGPVDIWVRRASPEFLTGLDLEGVRVTSSFASWYARALRCAVARPTCVALNAGEIWVSWPRAVSLCMLALLAAVARMRGGFAVWLGASIRPTKQPLLKLAFRLTIQSMTMVRWRESRSNERGLPRAVGPDWAFAAGSNTSEWASRSSRDVAAFIMRGDRVMPSEAWLLWVGQLLERMSLSPVFVVQVKSDKERAVALASRLGGTILDWPDDMTHRAQEREVRALFQRTTLAIGDRLHGLVLAATEGAVPIGWVESSTGKIAAHFNAAGLGYVGRFEGERFSVVPEVGEAEIAAWAERLPIDITESRKIIEDMRTDLNQLAAARVPCQQSRH